jgi:hypothetical protein
MRGSLSITGPINAGVFPNRNFDPTLNAESLFFYGPNTADELTSYPQAKHWMNFGAAEVAENGALRVKIINAEGSTVYQTELLPQ